MCVPVSRVDGGSLFSYVVQQDCLTEGFAVECLHQLLSALQYLHTHHIAHLDIKVCACVCIYIYCILISQRNVHSTSVVDIIEQVKYHT